MEIAEINLFLSFFAILSAIILRIIEGIILVYIAMINLTKALKYE